MDNNMTLRLAINDMNGTIGAEGLVPGLRVSKCPPRFSVDFKAPISKGNDECTTCRKTLNGYNNS